MATRAIKKKMGLTCIIMSSRVGQGRVLDNTVARPFARLLAVDYITGRKITECKPFRWRVKADVCASAASRRNETRRDVGKRSKGLLIQDQIEIHK